VSLTKAHICPIRSSQVACISGEIVNTVMDMINREKCSELVDELVILKSQILHHFVDCQTVDLYVVPLNTIAGLFRTTVIQKIDEF
jgi:hypothetical protein